MAQDIMHIFRCQDRGFQHEADGNLNNYFLHICTVFLIVERYQIRGIALTTTAAPTATPSDDQQNLAALTHYPRHLRSREAIVAAPLIEMIAPARPSATPRCCESLQVLVEPIEQTLAGHRERASLAVDESGVFFGEQHVVLGTGQGIV